MNGEIFPEPSKFVFVFYNTRSGDGRGKDLNQYAEQFFRLKDLPDVQVQMFHLNDGTDNSNGFVYLHETLDKFPNSEFHIWSAGGDGTFVWVLDHLVKLNIDIADKRLTFSPLSFGTGNDLPQFLLWEKIVKRHHTKDVKSFAKVIQHRLRGTRAQMDIWSVSVSTGEGGTISSSVLPDGGTNTMTRLMSNYMTLGMQGLVGHSFETNRHSSRLANIGEYIWQSIRVGIFGKMERLKNYFSSITYDDYDYKIHKKSDSVELLIQNIPGIWARSINLWGDCAIQKSVLATNPPRHYFTKKEFDEDPTLINNWMESCMNDGKVEIFAVKSRLDYLLKQLPCFRAGSLARLGQFPSPFSINLKPNEKVHMMTDGEFYILDNAQTITLERAYSIEVMANTVV